jgi:hypothetical protein
MPSFEASRRFSSPMIGKGKLEAEMKSIIVFLKKPIVKIFRLFLRLAYQSRQLFVVGLRISIGGNVVAPFLM